MTSRRYPLQAVTLNEELTQLTTAMANASEIRQKAGEDQEFSSKDGRVSG